MASNGLGITESVIGAPVGNYAAYQYRGGVGMVASAEQRVKFDDFDQKVTTNVPTGWEAAVIDTGATVVGYTTLIAGTQGVISFGSATASEGAAIYMPKSVILTAGKKAYVEVRCAVSDVTDQAFQFGLTDLTATTNPEDLWTTTAASLATFGIVDGAATLILSTDKSNGGVSSITGDTARPLVASTWTTLAIGWDGATLKGFKDGKTVATATTRVPTDILLAPFIGYLNGNGGGAATCFVDYFRVAVER